MTPKAEQTELQLSRKGKNYKRAPYAYFKETAEQLGIRESELAGQLGYSPTNASTWRGAGKIPEVAKLACEALRRRHKGNGAFNKELMVAQVPKAQRDVFITMARALGVDLSLVDLGQGVQQ
jgi:hypothetical protein